jgi:hypothetical protein
MVGPTILLFFCCFFCRSDLLRCWHCWVRSYLRGHWFGCSFRPGTPLYSPWMLDSSALSWSLTLPIKGHRIPAFKKIPFFYVLYHQSSERYPGHTARAPPLSRGGRVQTGDQTTASPMPWPLGHAFIPHGIKASLCAGRRGALGSRSANRCAFKKNEKYTLWLKLSKKTHCQRDQAGGKT